MYPFSGSGKQNSTIMQTNVTEPLYRINEIQCEAVDASEEIGLIHNSINELQSVFSTLHMLAFGQAELVDRIDHNIAQCMNSSRATAVQLQRGISKANSKLSFRKFIYLIGLGIIGILIYVLS